MKNMIMMLKKSKPPKDTEDGYDDEKEEDKGSVQEDAGLALQEALDSGDAKSVYQAVADIVKLLS